MATGDDCRHMRPVAGSGKACRTQGRTEGRAQSPPRRCAWRLIAVVLAALALLPALGSCSGAADAPQTPEAAFEQMRTAAAAGDFASFFDMCDSKGQSGLFELASALITIELADRRSIKSGGIPEIKRAFKEELGVEPDELENADRDYASRRKYFLLFVQKSRGVARDTFREALTEFAAVELVSCEMEGEDVARLRLRSQAGEKTWFMVREDGRWVLSGGLSPTSPPPVTKMPQPAVAP